MSEESVKMFPSSLFCINVFLLLIHSSLQDLKLEEIMNALRGYQKTLSKKVDKINKAHASKKQKIDEYVDCQSKLLEGQSGPSYIASGKDFCDNVGPRYNDYLQQGTKELEVWKIYLDKQEEYFSLQIRLLSDILVQLTISTKTMTI
ncbi:hypothetical protein KSF78_0005303 [Schistosoma japonicum]|nr:hypothetical protein KSF78_0005303 [Schistosoma japonicum]